jgi:hypothetical protein
MSAALTQDFRPGIQARFVGDIADAMERELIKELRVESKSVDAPSQHVGNATSGAVIAGKEFQIVEGVVRLIPGSFVVNRFSCQQRTTEELLHDVAVFKYIPRGTAVFAGDDQSNVSALDVPRRPDVSVLELIPDAPEEGSALRTTQPLLPVHGSARATLDRHWFAALDTGDLPLFVSQTLGKAGALGRAVHRVFVVQLSVLRQICRFHGEIGAAVFADKVCRDGLGGRPTVSALVCAFARAGAKLLSVMRRLYGEGVSALFAGLWDRHSGGPFLAVGMTVSTERRGV